MEFTKNFVGSWQWFQLNALLSFVRREKRILFRSSEIGGGVWGEMEGRRGSNYTRISVS